MCLSACGRASNDTIFHSLTYSHIIHCIIVYDAKPTVYAASASDHWKGA